MSRKYSVRVGVITLALTLIGLGVVWMVQNLTGVSYFSLLTRWWPVLLILLGLEYLWRHNRYSPEVSVRWSVGSLLLIFLIASGLANAAWVPSIPFQHVRDLVIHGNPMQERYSFQLEPIQDFPGKSVRIVNSTGDIQVQRSNDGNIHIKGTMSYLKQNPESNDAVPGKVKVVPGDTLLIVVETSDGFDLLNVNYEVELPSGLNLEISNDGRVQVTGLYGSLGVENQTGAVTVNDIRGKVGIRNNSGNIFIQRVVGDTALRSNLGMIEVNGFEGSLSAESNTGAINVKTDKPVTENWELTTYLGSIETHIPERSSVVLEASTQLGSVTGSNKINWQSQNGKKVSLLGDGQGSIRMTAQKGSIDVRVND